MNYLETLTTAVATGFSEADRVRSGVWMQALREALPTAPGSSIVLVGRATDLTALAPDHLDELRQNSGPMAILCLWMAQSRTGEHSFGRASHVVDMYLDDQSIAPSLALCFLPKRVDRAVVRSMISETAELFPAVQFLLVTSEPRQQVLAIALAEASEIAGTRMPQFRVRQLPIDPGIDTDTDYSDDPDELFPPIVARSMIDEISNRPKPPAP